MHKKIIIVLLLLSTMSLLGQEKQSLKNILGTKVGLVGAWINYEKVLSSSFTINLELGYQGGFLKATGDNDLDYIFTTNISIEPRFYYNFQRRIAKGKKIINNSANYFAAELFFLPDWFTSSNRNGVQSVVQGIGVIPKYGLRRSLTKNLSFEMAFGLGYYWGENNHNQVAAALDIRLSYSFF